MVVARVLLELLTVLHRADDTVVVVFVASLTSTKEQQKADRKAAEEAMRRNLKDASG